MGHFSVILFALLLLPDADARPVFSKVRIFLFSSRFTLAFIIQPRSGLLRKGREEAFLGGQ